MSQIKLKKMTINYFKGIKSREIDFRNITNIFGKNESGKSSLMDAFLWLWFGKNANDESKFNIKKLDEQNNFIKGVETSVSQIVEIDGVEIEVKKILRQKWQTRRGEATETYSGDENIYMWNDVPLKEGEFNNRVKEVINSELVFKLITNPLYFNEKLSWQERRNTLIDIAGHISDIELVDQILPSIGKEKAEVLYNAIKQGKNKQEFKDFKAELAAKKTKINKEKDQLPGRIDEVYLGIPEDQNFDEVKKQLADVELELTSLNELENNALLAETEENTKRSKLLVEHNKKVQDKQQKVFAIKTDMQNIEFDVKAAAKDQGGKIDAEIKSTTNSLNEKKDSQKRYKDLFVGLESDLAAKEKEIEDFRAKYDEVDAEKLEFNDSEFVCPSCQQALPQNNIEAKKQELTNNFNKDKIKKLGDIAKDADKAKADKAAIQTRIDNGKTMLADVEKSIGELETKLAELQQKASTENTNVDAIYEDLLSKNEKYQVLKSDLATTEAIELIEPKFDDIKSDDERKAKIKTLTEKASSLQKEVGKEEQIAKQKADAQTRINELTDQQTKLAQELVEIEGTEFALMQFTKAKVDTIEKRINGKFKIVKFKMFTTQVNGGEQECCETLVNGVPWKDVNTAGKINAGVDIINTLTEHYNSHAPIFIDNRESITDLIECNSQVVNLIVSPQDKTLRVA